MAAGETEDLPMTGDDVRKARHTLGQAWGLGRPLHAAELGRVLGLGGRDPGRSVVDYERGATRVSGPMALALELLLAGARPADLEDRLRS
jgi:hypothetical protein